MDDQRRGHRRHPRPHEGHKPAGEGAKRGAHHAAESVSPAAKQWLPYAAVVSAAALVLTAAVLLMSRPSGITPRRPPPPPPVERETQPALKAPARPRERREAGTESAFEAPERQNAHDAFRRARRYETDHPKDFRGAITRYEAVAREFPGTPEAGIAQMNVARLKSVAGLAPSHAAPPRAAASSRIPPDALEFDGHTYRAYRQAVTWGEAKAHCERLGGHLVTIASEEESDFVIALAKEAGGNVWIGMSDRPHRIAHSNGALAKQGRAANLPGRTVGGRPHDDGKWGWVTGEDVTFTAWAPGTPNSLQGVEQHVCLWKGAEFAWDDGSGLGAAGKQQMYVCEWEKPTPSARPHPARAASSGPPVGPARAASSGPPVGPDRAASSGPPVGPDRAASSGPPAGPAAEDVGGRLAPLLAEFDSFMQRHKFAGAKRLAERRAAGLTRGKRRKSKANRALAGALRSAARTAALLESRRETIHRAAAALGGQEVTVETRKGPRKGKLIDVTEVGFALVIQMRSGRQIIGETRMPVSWADLTVRQLDRFAKAWKPEGAEGAFARAILALESGEIQAAERELKAAGEGLFADHLRRKIDALRLQEAEGNAQASWETIRRWAERPEMTLEQAKSLFDLVTLFETKHGRSGLASSRREEIARAKLRARRILVAAGLVQGSVEFADHRYKLYRHAVCWSDAKRFCERLGGHLVTITSDEENSFVTGIARKADSVAWIGLSMEARGAQWRWVTGEKSDFRAWGEAGRRSGASTCAFIHPERDYRWSTSRPSGIGFIICEWEPPRRVQTPAPSASEALPVLPAGGRKAVLYREDFENGTGDWRGRAVEDEKGRGNVLRLEVSSEQRYYAVRASRGSWEGTKATLDTRFSVRYRTRGRFSRLFVLVVTGSSRENRRSYQAYLPTSAAWAHADFPAKALRSSARHGGQLGEEFVLSFVSVCAGRHGEEGECFIDDFELYDVVGAQVTAE